MERSSDPPDPTPLELRVDLHLAGMRDIAGDEAETPAGHVERLGERMQLDGDVFCAGNLQDGRRTVAVVVDFGVGRVVDDEQIVLPRVQEMHEALEGLPLKRSFE